MELIEASKTAIKVFTQQLEETDKQYHWKPTEEQINAIVEALKYLPNNKDEWMILDTLMDELMKLM